MIPTSLLFRALLCIIGVCAMGTGLLGGGYGLSLLMFPTWPTDYHATFAIAFMSVLLIVSLGIFAALGGRKRSA